MGGADVHGVDDEGNTALRLVAAQPGATWAVMELMEARADVNDCDHRGASALTWASAFSGDARIITVLLAARADFSVLDEEGLSPLMAASVSGHSGVVRVLLEAQANPDSSGSSFGCRAGSAMGLATEQGHMEVMDLLMQAAANNGR